MSSQTALNAVSRLEAANNRIRLLHELFKNSAVSPNDLVLSMSEQYGLADILLGVCEAMDETLDAIDEAGIRVRMEKESGHE